MNPIESSSVQLVVTSPPYPMIEMWDTLFSEQSDKVKKALENSHGSEVFELMHAELDSIWEECYRVLEEGCFLCINIGDATRTINKEFQLYANHARILQKLIAVGFQILPEILWRKQTNAPNKFMGSGMLPAGAYVTLEHEYILIARKGGKRIFKTEKEKNLRQESAFFWEERNIWFSDVWDFKGVHQKLKIENMRERSAAYPFELAYRLLNMYSVKGDTVLDPFVGTGTTLLAAMLSERNSIGIDINAGFENTIAEIIKGQKENLNDLLKERLENHKKFIETRIQQEKETKYENINHNIPVVTKQEEKLLLRSIETIKQLTNNEFKVSYEKIQ
jgi:DNA modification methylase